MSRFNNNIDKSKNWYEVIKNESTGNELLWHFPIEDFNDNSVLIVKPGECAIFVQDGDIVSIFEHGRYELRTGNMPFISAMINSFSGGVSSNNCEVYFLRVADSQELLWGTKHPIMIRDKRYGVITSVSARGSYRIRIIDPECFFEILIGNGNSHVSQEDITRYFDNEFQQYIQAALTAALGSITTDLVEINKYNFQIANALKPAINRTVSSYGIECVSFSVAAMETDLSTYKMMDELHLNNIINGGNPDFSNQVNSSSETDDVERVLAKLKSLYENRLISEDDYNYKRKEILSKYF